MNDEYVQREGNEICVMDGKRDGLVRRESSRRGTKVPGIFVINAINQRENDTRRHLDERREPETVTNLECSIERGSSLIIWSKPPSYCCSCYGAGNNLSSNYRIYCGNYLRNSRHKFHFCPNTNRMRFLF